MDPGDGEPVGSPATVKREARHSLRHHPSPSHHSAAFSSSPSAAAAAAAWPFSVVERRRSAGETAAGGVPGWMGGGGVGASQFTAAPRNPAADVTQGFRVGSERETTAVGPVQVEVKGFSPSVFKPSPVTMQTLSQYSLFPPVVTDSSGYHHVAEHQEPEEAIENHEMGIHILSTEPTIEDPCGNLVPTHRRKIVQQRPMSSLSLTSVPYGGKSNHIQTSSGHVDDSWGQSTTDSTHNSRHLPNPFYSEPHFGYPHSGNHSKPKDEKEFEDRGWRMLLQKELRNSDVGSLGRIVLPKKEAEANLPQLLEKDGVILHMFDMASAVLWAFKYRFWPNNKSRMYILENTGMHI